MLDLKIGLLTPKIPPGMSSEVCASVFSRRKFIGAIGTTNVPLFAALARVASRRVGEFNAQDIDMIAGIVLRERYVRILMVVFVIGVLTLVFLLLLPRNEFA